MWHDVDVVDVCCTLYVLYSLVNLFELRSLSLCPMENPNLQWSHLVCHTICTSAFSASGLSAHSLLNCSRNFNTIHEVNMAEKHWQIIKISSTCNLSWIRFTSKLPCLCQPKRNICCWFFFLGILNMYNVSNLVVRCFSLFSLSVSLALLFYTIPFPKNIQVFHCIVFMAINCSTSAKPYLE